MQAGKTKDQGLYNKPSAAVHQGALAAGTVPQYNTVPKEHFNYTLFQRLQFYFHSKLATDMSFKYVYRFKGKA